MLYNMYYIRIVCKFVRMYVCTYVCIYVYMYNMYNVYNMYNTFIFNIYTFIFTHKEKNYTVCNKLYYKNSML